jgi:hypothetical protein
MWRVLCEHLHLCSGTEQLVHEVDLVFERRDESSDALVQHALSDPGVHVHEIIAIRAVDYRIGVLDRRSTAPISCIQSIQIREVLLLLW